MSAMRRPIFTACSKTASVFSAPARRTFANAQKPDKLRSSCVAARPSSRRPELQYSFRRSYADAVSPTTSRRGRGFLRWTWRLTYLSFIGGAAYLFYNIYTIRTPHEQFAPDPAKKTLVILGMSAASTNTAVIDSLQAPVGAQSPF